MKSFSKICRSESTLSCRSHHSCLKINAHSICEKLGRNCKPMPQEYVSNNAFKQLEQQLADACSVHKSATENRRKKWQHLGYTLRQNDDNVDQQTSLWNPFITFNDNCRRRTTDFEHLIHFNFIYLQKFCQKYSEKYFFRFVVIV